MAQLPDYLIDKIMIYNRHPLAEIFHDLYEPYREALHIQHNSSDLTFRAAGSPSFWDYKRHGLHCEEWDDIFYTRHRVQQNFAWLDSYSDFDLDAYRREYGAESMQNVHELRYKLKYWREERAILELFIYRDTSIYWKMQQ